MTRPLAEQTGKVWPAAVANNNIQRNKKTLVKMRHKAQWETWAERTIK